MSCVTHTICIKVCMFPCPVNMWANVIRYTTKANYNNAVRRTKEHHGIFTYKLINNHFCHSIPVTFNGDFHSYYTRSRNDIRKSSATRRWGHWSSVNFSADIWNGLDTSLRNAESSPAFKRGLSKVVFDS